MSAPTDFHGIPSISCHIVLSLGCVAWKSRHVEQFLTMCSMPVFMLIQKMDLYTHSLIFSMPIWFMCSWFSTFPWNAAGIIILLFFMAILSIIAIWSLNYQYDCSSFCTSALVDGQPYNTYSDHMLQCSSSIVIDIISSAVMQSGMSIHDPMAFMVMFIPSISSSRSCGCVFRAIHHEQLWSEFVQYSYAVWMDA